MAAESFRACWIEKDGASLQMELKQVPFEELATGEEYVRVKVDYSGVNYKDGMAICGIYGVVETLPLITGIDFAGTVDETKAGFKKGDRVIMTGGWAPKPSLPSIATTGIAGSCQWLLRSFEGLEKFKAIQQGYGPFRFGTACWHASNPTIPGRCL